MHEKYSTMAKRIEGLSVEWDRNCRDMRKVSVVSVDWRLFLKSREESFGLADKSRSMNVAFQIRER